MALYLGADYYLGRLFSFMCAVTFTWLANRYYTFKSTNSRLLREWGQFVFANSFGGSINYGVYVLALLAHPLFTDIPVLAVGLGSLAGLLVNYTLSNKIVFTHR